MNEVIPTSYNLPLVVLSYLIAVVGSYIALTATAKMRNQTGRSYTTNLLMAGTALGGIGVWAMHFIGMLAVRIPMGMAYSMVETVISLVAAIAATAWGLGIVARNPKSLLRLLGAGAMLGLGVAIMHYLGMYGMRFGGFFQWDMSLIMISVLIAFAAATAALWLAFNTHSTHARAMAAAVMGIAVCAMHYTGMLAADVVCTTEQRFAIPSGLTFISALQLPMLVITLVVGMTLAIVLNLVYAPQSGKRAVQA